MRYKEQSGYIDQWYPEKLRSVEFHVPDSFQISFGINE